MEARVARKRREDLGRLKTSIMEEKHLREELEEAIDAAEREVQKLHVDHGAADST